MKPGLVLIMIVLGLPTLGLTLYLQYSVLKLINATELMWFMYWIQMPLMIILTIIQAIIKEIDE